MALERLREEMLKADVALEVKLENFEESLDRIESKTDSIYSLLLQGTGAVKLVKYVLWFIALVGFVSFSQWFGKALNWLGGTGGGNHG